MADHRKTRTHQAALAGKLVHGGLVCVGFGLVFGAGWYLFRDSDVRSVQTFLLGTGFGAYVGLVALPVLAPKTYTHRPVLYGAVAAAITAALSLVHALDLGLAAGLTLGAAIIGFLAPYWIKHIQL